MNFKHPADAMRARFRDELSCFHCKHIHPVDPELEGVPWCLRQELRPPEFKPITNEEKREDCVYCELFEHETEALKHHIADWPSSEDWETYKETHHERFTT